MRRARRDGRGGVSWGAVEMGVRMIESFRHLIELEEPPASAIDELLAARWVGGQFNEVPAITSITGEVAATTETCMQLGNAQSRWLSNEAVNRWIFAGKVGYTSAAPRTGILFSVEKNDGASHRNVAVFQRRLDDSVYVTDWSGATLATSGAAAIQPGQGNFYETDVVMGTATGSVRLWIDGDLILSATDIDLVNGGTVTDINQTRFPGNFGVAQYSRMRIWDGLGTDFNEPLGQITTNQTVLPSGTGALGQWLANGTATNYEQVDDDPVHDGDVTHVETETYGLADLHIVPGLPVNVDSVHGVQVTAVARRTAGGDSDLKVLCMSNGTTATGGEAAPGGQRNMGLDLLWLNEIFETDPDTGAGWLPTATYQVGYRLASATTP